MPSQALLQLLGSKGNKDARYAPIFTDRFFVGYWSNRNPLRSPLSTFYADGWHLGGTDAIISGENIELSPRLTLCRRPGSFRYSTADPIGAPLTFYPFRLFGVSGSASIDVIVDTKTNVIQLTPTARIGIFTKSAGAGQSNFLGIGQTLYFGDGVEVMAWQNGTIRNWGISIGAFSSSPGTETAGTGTSSDWTNPADVTGSSGFATAALTDASPSGPFLSATNFSYSIDVGQHISGISISFNAFATLTGSGGDAAVFVQLMKNGSTVGNALLVPLPVSSATLTVGGSGDLWDTTFSPNDINNSEWGVAFTAVGGFSGTGTINFSLQNVQTTVYATAGPSVSPTGSGAFVAYTGYSYAAAYGNSASGQVSSATPVSFTTGPLGAGVNTSTVAAPGINYAPGDTGFISAGNFDGMYTIGTVDGSGGVLTYTISPAGSAYQIANNVSTFLGGTQPGTGSGFAINVTAVSGYSGLNVGLIASTDPQVNQIWLFRTADGGNTWLNLPTSPYPNTTQTVLDSAPDSQLDILAQAPLNFVNNPPPTAALDPVYYLDLVWVHVGNAVYFSRTPSEIVGVTQESFPPANVFTFPETVIRKIAFSAGLLVFTTSNIYIVLGNNTSTSPLYSAPFLNGYGIQSWNALWTDGSIIYFFTSDNRMMELNPSSGVSDLGFPIGDQLATLNPASVYVAYNSTTSNDVALYLADGSTGWYRCNPNQAPDGAITGPVWSPKANIVGGLGALVAMETSPGVHQLMMGGTNTGPVLLRDSTYTIFTDDGSGYPANFVVGSIVLAQPGQAAVCRFVTCDFIRTGTSPIVSVLLGEISGTFENISGYVVPDPPYLPAATSLYNNRYYFKQTVAGANPKPVVCRHLQIQVDYGTDIVQNEILSMTINGAIFHEK